MTGAVLIFLALAALARSALAIVRLDAEVRRLREALVRHGIRDNEGEE